MALLYITLNPHIKKKINSQPGEYKNPEEKQDTRIKHSVKDRKKENVFQTREWNI